MMLKRLVSLGVAMAACFGVPAPAEACSCGGGRCGDIATADTVLIATVEAIRLENPGGSAEARASSPGLRFGPVRVASLRGVRALRGAPAASVVTAMHNVSCGYDFQAGRRYLIVAQREANGTLSVSTCGLTRPIEEAEALIDYLAMTRDATRQTRVWGRVSRETRWADFTPEYQPMPGATVTFSGPVDRAVTTARDGRYVVSGLEPGRYRVNVRPPADLLHVGAVSSREIELLGADACAEVDFAMRGTGTIRGRIVDATGAPLAGVFVRLGLADQRDLSRGLAGSGAETDGDGWFELRHLPPGRYLVGLSLERNNGPFAMARARTLDGDPVVTLPFGGTVELPPLVARRLNQIVVPGSVRTASGEPARGVSISVTAFGPRGEPLPDVPVSTDAEGRFSLRLWQGERYRIRIGTQWKPDLEVEFVAETNRPMVLTLLR